MLSSKKASTRRGGITGHKWKDCFFKKQALYCSASLWKIKVKIRFFTEKVPFKFAQNIDQVYVQVMPDSNEETTLFHSIYSCVFVHKPTTHKRQRRSSQKLCLSICSPTIQETKHRKDNIDFPEVSVARHDLLREKCSHCSLALGQEVIRLSDCTGDLC